MSDYTKSTHSISNTKVVARYIESVSTQDRALIFTKWIDQLINVGAAPSVNQAAKMIGQDIGMDHKAVSKYYGGAQ